MTAPNTGNPPPTEGSPSSTPPSGTPTAGTPGATSAPEPWRAPETAPAWARGRTAEEILAASTALAEQNQQMYGLLQQQLNPPKPQAQPVQIADDDFTTGAQVRGYLDQRAQQFQQALGSTANQTASVIRGFIETQDPEPFKRWGREIDALLQNVPKEQWTLDAVRQAVRIVKADHVDELAAERAEQLAAERIPTMRSNGGAGTGSVPTTSLGLDSPTIPDHWKRSAAAVGLGESELREFCAANGMTPDQFVEQFGKGNLLTAVSENKVDPRSVRRV